MLEEGYIKRQGPNLAVAAAVTLAFIVVGTYGPSEISKREIFGMQIQDYASLKDATEFPVGIFIAMTVLSNILLTFLKHLWQTYGSPSVGYGPVSKDNLRSILPGLEVQVEVLARRASWPAHDSTASPAKSVRRVDFGDALYTTPSASRQLIKRFLGHPRRIDNSEETIKSILLVKGEPGAGKSILTQEIHASLVKGIKIGRHSCLPIILFAADLRLTDFHYRDGHKPSLREFISQKLSESGHAETSRLASFLALNWAKYDLMIVVDGLDEIAQRSAYAEIQVLLKDLIEAEILNSGGRVRRFIFSCRSHDDVGTFDQSPSILLKGLNTQDERERFCENLVRANVTSKAERSNVERMLRTESAQLSSADLFRRNPYFLSLLIRFLSDSKHILSSDRIDFRLIINDFIRRESLRPFRTADGSTHRFGQEEIYNQFDKLASLFSKYFSYYITSFLEDDSLYNQSTINKAMITGFVETVLKYDIENPSDPWTNLGKFIVDLTSNERLTEGLIRHFAGAGSLYENDIRLFGELARDHTSSAEDAVFAAFGQIALEGRLEKEEWYRGLAVHIAAEVPDLLSSNPSRLAVQLFARGLTAAHALRLIYIERKHGVPLARFRHRRLAEFFAACYFKERWHECAWLTNSPWLTPVLNLVAAIEGESCLAFDLLVSKVGIVIPERAFEWRSQVTDAAEVAAFTQRSLTYSEILARFVTVLITAVDMAWHKDRSKHDGRRDLASQFSAINAIGFVGEIESGEIVLKEEVIRSAYATLRRQPPPFVVSVARAAHSLKRLTSRRIPAEFRSDLFFSLLSYPVAIFGEFRSAKRYGFVLEWLLAGFAMLISELIALVTFNLALATAVYATMNEGTQASLVDTFWILAVPISLFWFAYRFFRWRRSPSSANRVNKAIMALLAVGFAIPLLVVVGPFALLYLMVKNFGNAFRLISKYLVRFIRFAVEMIGDMLLWLYDLRHHYKRIIVSTVVILIAGTGLWGVGSFSVALWTHVSTQDPSKEVGSQGSARSTAVSTGGAGFEKAVGRPTLPVAGNTQAVLVQKANCTAVKQMALSLEGLGATRLTRAAEIAEWRAHITRLANEVVIADEEDRCLDWWQGNHPSNEAVFGHLRPHNDLAIPIYDGGPPSFGESDFATLAGLLRDAEAKPIVSSNIGTWLGIAGIGFYQRGKLASQGIEALETHFKRLERALNDGSISDRPGGTYPNPTQFLELVNRVDQMLKLKVERVASLTKFRADMERHALRSLGRFVIVIFCTLCIILLAVSAIRDRRDRKLLDQAAQTDFVGLMALFVTNGLSDRVRTGLASILSELKVDHSELADLELAIQKIAGSDDQRDIKFASELTIALDRISRRLS